MSGWSSLWCWEWAIVQVHFLWRPDGETRQSDIYAMYVTPPHIFYCISTHFNSFWTLFDMGLKNMLLTDIYLKFNIYIYIYIHGTWSRAALGLQTCQHVALLSHQQTQCRLSNETDFPQSGPGYQWSFRNSLDQMTYLAWPIRKSIGTAVAETLPIYVRYSTGPKIRHYFAFRCPGLIRYKCLYIYIYIYIWIKSFFGMGIRITRQNGLATVIPL